MALFIIVLFVMPKCMLYYYFPKSVCLHIKIHIQKFPQQRAGHHLVIQGSWISDRVYSYAKAGGDAFGPPKSNYWPSDSAGQLHTRGLRSGPVPPGRRARQCVRVNVLVVLRPVPERRWSGQRESTESVVWIGTRKRRHAWLLAVGAAAADLPCAGGSTNCSCICMAVPVRDTSPRRAVPDLGEGAVSPLFRSDGGGF